MARIIKMKTNKYSVISDELLTEKLKLYFMRCKIASGDIALKVQLAKQNRIIASLSASDQKKR